MASLLYLLLLAVTSPLLFSSTESRKELRDKESNHDPVIQLGLSIRNNRVDPSRVVQLSWQPRVFLYEGFLSDEECDHLISLARGSKKTTRGDEDGSGSIGMNGIFSSSETPLDEEDDKVTRVQERISAWTFIPKGNGKPPVVMHYGLEKAEQKFDYYGNKSKLRSSEPLLATVVLYLSNVTQGGEILFPNSEPKKKIWSDCAKTSNILRPIKGNAILFFTRHPNASPDTSSAHVRCPVLNGDMWYAFKLFFVRAADGRKVSVESDDRDCTDEDDNCFQWAAIGECQRNPVFMIGSPDYYGTCRKSCNVC
ncbi:probable prolyl 4-hydroxylase 12 isoform X2 [Tripterygium wilfordii]|uniref:probable prolyl 4-hydroxylase 12 isoform X2 n=1 Tax=Tripterygium wilfordii TaxID=458696 RepID=UPI0018F82F09|nr:probable prolyl 4-hydroxylase 12 isoform X2 [Tripterygium wilfordii]